MHRTTILALKALLVVMVVFMLLGVVAIIGSTGVYAWIGLLSMKTSCRGSMASSRAVSVR